MSLCRLFSMLAVSLVCTTPIIALEKEPAGQCSSPSITSSDSICQVVSQGSLSFVCTTDNNLSWSSSLWEGEINVSAGNDTRLPALKVKDVTLKEKNTVNNKTNCLSSTLIFAGTITNLAQLDNKLLSCSNIPEQQIDTIAISLPVLLGPPTLTNISSSLECDSAGTNNQTIQWTPPTTADVVIEHYEVTGIPQSAICSPGPCDMINATNTTTTISGLECDTDYMISVRAVSVCGINGTFSDPIRVIFHPRPVSISVATSTTITAPDTTSTTKPTSSTSHTSSAPSTTTAATNNMSSSSSTPATTNRPMSSASTTIATISKRSITSILRTSVTETLIIMSCTPTDVQPSITEIIRYASCTPTELPLEQHAILSIEVGIPATFILTAIISSLLTLLVTFLCMKRKGRRPNTDYDTL